MGAYGQKSVLWLAIKSYGMDKHSDVYSRGGGVSLIMLLCPVVINRPVGGVISVRNHSCANHTAKQAHCGQFNAD